MTKNQVDTVKKQAMQSFVDADSVTFICPCGQSVSGEGEIITQFLNEHKPHSDGTHLETITADGARFMTPPAVQPQVRKFS